MADVVIRGGTILDGLGGESFEADLAIDGSKISEIGQNVPKGNEEIDATGKIANQAFDFLKHNHENRVMHLVRNPGPPCKN